MELSKAFEMAVEYYGEARPIKVDTNGYICLNDMAEYFPKKKIKEWLKNKSTQEFIEVLNRGNSPQLKCLVTRRGKYNGGTYADSDLAMEFAMWLSPEFKLHVIREYRNGTQTKKDWNIKRIMASSNFKMMQESKKDEMERNDHVSPFGYSNEAKLINIVVFGSHEKGIRDHATESELEKISMLESRNSAYLDLDMSYEDRKQRLKEIYLKENKKEVIG